MAEAVRPLQFEDAAETLPSDLCIQLRLRDPEVVSALWRKREGAERDGFATSAIRLGILALEQASGMVDSTMIRREGERLFEQMRELLRENAYQLSSGLAGALAHYFDPANGDLVQRLDRLIRRDGELESVLRRHLDGESSTIARTLAQHLGSESPVVRLLSPSARDGVVEALRTNVEEALKGQRDALLREFSLDDRNSAMSRLVGELTDANERLQQGLTEDLGRVRAEFSLDNEASALSRLVNRVERAQQRIVEEFSLDNDCSALSRLAAMLERQHANNAAFQAEVRAAVEALRVRRDEAARSTRHGQDFEDAVGELLRREAQRQGDSFEPAGARPGARRNCKIGDFVVTLSPESRAPGARLVVEAKENASYDVAAALEELAIARENRAANVGIFVFSRATAPQGLEPLSRHGDDILVVWDRDEETSDVYLKTAVSLGRALAVRSRIAADEVKAEFGAIDKAVTRILKDVEALAEITTWAGNVKRDGGKIEDRIAKVSENLERQVETLTEELESLRRYAARDET